MAAARQMMRECKLVRTESQVTGTNATCDNDFYPLFEDAEDVFSQLLSPFQQTNSKAFTAKTSCVRRRYSEFVWLKKKLQKNAGLV